MAKKILLLTGLALLSACVSRAHTLESTKEMTRNELLGLCEDLQMRAAMDCRWNVEAQQSPLSNQQTWEINCRTRRDSARDSYDNVCLPSRLRQPEVITSDQRPSPDDPPL